MDFDLLEQHLEAAGTPAYRRRQVYTAVTQTLVGDYASMTTLPKDLREKLAKKVPFSTVKVDHEESSDDGSVKLRLLTHDNFPIEAVLMRFETRSKTSSERGERFTACLSSQSGCALACTFCATGAMGLGRNLTRFEIFDQFLMLARSRGAAGGRIDNVVMMGMGEPFHNYDEVLAACRLMNDDDGVNLAARRIAISTVGWIPGIDRLGKEDIQVKLALSLHAPNDEIRSELMPVTKRYPVAELMAACRRYRRETHRRIFIEYLMLDGINDKQEHARELAKLLGTEGFHVNLIAYNPTASNYVGSHEDTVTRFGRVLDEYGVRNSYRVSRGRDISAACGQLAAPLTEARKAARAARTARAEQAASK